MQPAQEVIGIAQKASLFREMDLVGVEEAVKMSQMRNRSGGEFFFLEDDPADTAYMLIEGKVKLTQSTLDGQQIILGYLSLIHISEPTRLKTRSRMPSSA